MARVYIELVRTVLPRGPLLLGGWSFGGIVAIEMALQLAAQSDLTVLGIVLIDSVFPTRGGPGPDVIWQTPPLCPAGVPLHVKREIRLCMAMSVELLERWSPSLPQRDGTLQKQWRSNRRPSTPPTPPRQTTPPGTSAAADYPAAALGMPTPPGTPELVAASPVGQLHDNFRLRGMPQPAHSTAPPTAVLLRAQDPVPVPENEKKGDTTVSRVDVHRNKFLLGWESYPHEFIHAVFHVPGHHFNIFDPENIPSLGEHLDQACRMLERV
jgi:pimeloyl-ACP methyl ester carboxylesterase